MTFILSFITMFMLVKYLTKNSMSGFVSGVAYSICPYHLAHLIYPSLCQIEWIPLFFLSLFVLERNRTTFFCLVSALLWGVVAYSDAYYGFMCAILAGLFMLYYLFSVDKMMKFFLFSLFIIIPFGVWSFSLWKQRLDCNPVPVIANLWDYFNLYNTNGIEHWLFIFPVWLIFVGFGIRRHNLFWVIVIMLSLFLSLSEPMCPIFRVSARWGIMVMLGVSVLAGYGLKRMFHVEQKEVVNKLKEGKYEK